VPIECPHLDLDRALHPVVDAGNRQAAFLALALFGTGPFNFRVDEHQPLVTGLADVDHDQSLMHIHLGGRQTDAVSLIHGHEHALDQVLDALVDRGDWPGHRVQAGIGVAQDGQGQGGGHGQQRRKFGRADVTLCHGSPTAFVVIFATFVPARCASTP